MCILLIVRSSYHAKQALHRHFTSPKTMKKVKAWQLILLAGCRDYSLILRNLRELIYWIEVRLIHLRKPILLNNPMLDHRIIFDLSLQLIEAFCSAVVPHSLLSADEAYQTTEAAQAPPGSALDGVCLVWGSGGLRACLRVRAVPLASRSITVIWSDLT